VDEFRRPTEVGEGAAWMTTRGWRRVGNCVGCEVVEPLVLLHNGLATLLALLHGTAPHPP
jgi:hypothetical protein